MKKILNLISILFFFSSFAQDSLLVNKKYFEDQLYIGINYNVLQDKPDLLQQKGISINYQMGFIKDIPLNQRGSLAIGIGLGYAYNKFNQTLKIQKIFPEFSIIEDNYDQNKFETHVVEIPFEIRIRTSTSTDYKFWRLYIGGKIGYVFASKSIFSYKEITEYIKLKPIPYINKWQYGPQVSLGYGTWNIYTYFNLVPIFNKAPLSSNLNPNNLKSFKIGLQFYIF